MEKPLSLDEFISRNRIDQPTWEKAGIDWVVLQEIAADYREQYSQLDDSAAFFAKVIQKFDCVHSVRWRVKDVEHLLEKIVRKRAASVEKYASISVANYHEIVTDLVGIRVLHLFKEDCFKIGQDLVVQWASVENPVAYVRAGDGDDLVKLYADNGFDIKEHHAGYRSVHYVVSCQPTKRKVIAEVQVRTIFEEGWSEIDHTVRYPNFSDSQLVEYFLKIFNRLAGSADEMGGFVRLLTDNLGHLENQISEAKNENSQILNEMEKALSELASTKAKDKNSREHINKLQAELEKLKAVDVPRSPLGMIDFDIPAYVRNASGIDNSIAKAAAVLNAEGGIGIAAKYAKFLKDTSKLSFRDSAQLNALAAAAKGLDLSKVRGTNTSNDISLGDALRDHGTKPASDDSKDI